MNKYIFLILTIFLFVVINCNYGLNNGEDLEFDWFESSYNKEHGLYFNSKNQGLEYYNPSQTYCFTYEVLSDNPKNYKILKLKKYKAPNNIVHDYLKSHLNEYIKSDSDSITEKYEYYFSLDKRYLYLKKEGERYFATFSQLE